MLIQQKEDCSTGSFFISDDEVILAKLTYSLSAGIMIIHHTEVHEKIKGKNIGYNLLQSAATYAREKFFRIIPDCLFAKAIFERKPDEFGDLK